MGKPLVWMHETWGWVAWCTFVGIIELLGFWYVSKVPMEHRIIWPWLNWVVLALAIVAFGAAGGAIRACIRREKQETCDG